MMRIVAVVLTLLSAMPLQAGLVIVREGQPQAAIVTAAQPSVSAQRAAAELQKFIAMISGAKLPILAEPAAPPQGQAALYVGRTTASQGLEVPAGEDRDHSREGFVLKTGKGGLVLAGNEDGEYRGTEYAVYELLDRLGCRWYYPGEFGQVLPALKTIELPDLDVKGKPSFAVRNIWMSGWADAVPDYDQWLIRNKGSLRGGFAFPGDGTISQLAPMEKYGKDLPDIYAVMANGKRQDAATPAHLVMLCTTNPKAVEIAAGSIRDYFRAHPQANSFGFSAPDGSPRCYCKDCTAGEHAFMVDSSIGEEISDPYFNFVNNIAHEVTKEFPDKYIVVLAYANRVRPPEGLDKPWSKNILVQIARLRVSSLRPLGDKSDFFAIRRQRTLDAWARMAPKLLIYDYDPHADLSRMPYWRSESIGHEMKNYLAHGVIGFTTEGQATFFRTGLNYYVRARCMWDAKTDVSALLDDYHQRFFGPAAKPMRQFTDQIEAMLLASPDHMTWTHLLVDWSMIFPPQKVAALAKLLDEAEKLADTPAIKQRLALYRILHNYMTAYESIFTQYHAGQFAVAAAAIEKLPPLIQQAQTIQPGLLPPDPGWVLSEMRSLADLRMFMNTTAAIAGGPKGTLLGLAPESAQFRRDENDEGIFAQWQNDQVAKTMEWQTIPLTRDWGLAGERNQQGYAYPGLGWYRIRIKADKPPAGAGRAQLLLPIVYADKVWIWVNGQLVYSPTHAAPEPGSDKKPATTPLPGRPVSVDRRGVGSVMVDVQDQFIPGNENTIIIRMNGTHVRTQHRGLAGRPLIWASK